MTLYEKIISIYPELIITDESDFFKPWGPIIIQNDSDGKGDYIALWEHSTLTKPTEDQLQGIK